MDSRSAGKRTNAVQVDPRIAGLAADRKSGNFRFTATAAARSAKFTGYRGPLRQFVVHVSIHKNNADGHPGQHYDRYLVRS